MPGPRLLIAIALGAAAVAALVASASAAQSPARWRPLLEAHGVVDVVGPRSDGRLVVSTTGGLHVLAPGGALEAFATGSGGYAPAKGGEPYAALALDRRLTGARCSFQRDDVFVLDASSTPGIVRVTRDGRALRLLDFPKGAFPSGIAFDHTGRFGYMLMSTAVVADKTTLYAIDCTGRMTVVVRDAPRVEGGIVVAPSSFGRFGGDLIAADERSGKIFAFAPGGTVRLVVRAPLRAGSDIGVENLGFVPHAPGPHLAAYLADLGAPGSPTEGSDSILVLRGQDIARAGLRGGELVAATEGGAATIAVRCTRRCTVRTVAAGPAVTHAEGHVSFTP
jgi:hypothetical protein